MCEDPAFAKCDLAKYDGLAAQSAGVASTKLFRLKKGRSDNCSLRPDAIKVLSGEVRRDPLLQVIMRRDRRVNLLWSLHDRIHVGLTEEW